MQRWLRLVGAKVALTINSTTQQELDVIADSLDSRPWVTHNWRMPLQVFAAAFAGSFTSIRQLIDRLLHFNF